MAKIQTIATKVIICSGKLREILPAKSGKFYKFMPAKSGKKLLTIQK